MNKTAKSTNDLNFEKFYDHSVDWVIRYGPRLVIGLTVLFAGLC